MKIRKKIIFTTLLVLTALFYYKGFGLHRFYNYFDSLKYGGEYPENIIFAILVVLLPSSIALVYSKSIFNKKRLYFWFITPIAVAAYFIILFSLASLNFFSDLFSCSEICFDELNNIFYGAVVYFAISVFYTRWLIKKRMNCQN